MKKAEVLVSFGILASAAFYILTQSHVPVLDPSASYSGSVVLCEGESIEIPFPHPNPTTAQEVKCEGFVSIIPSVGRRYPVYGAAMAGNDMFPMESLSTDFMSVTLDMSIESENGVISDGCMSGPKALGLLSKSGQVGDGQTYYACTDPRSFPGAGQNASCGVLYIDVQGIRINDQQTELDDAKDCVHAVWGVVTHYQDRFETLEGGRPSISGIVEVSTRP